MKYDPKTSQKNLHLYPKQAEFINATERFTGFFAGRGAGKTYSGVAKILLKAKSGEPWMVISPDHNVILNTTFPMFIELAEKYGKLLRHKQSPYPQLWFRTNDGGKAHVLFRSGEAPEKIRGANVAGMWMDEASIQTINCFDISIACLRHNEKMGQAFLTATPRGKAHWTFEVFYQEITQDDIARGYVTFYEGKPHEVIKYFKREEVSEIGSGFYLPKPNTRLVRATSYDNPFIDENFAGTIETQYTSGFALQEIQGEFVDLGGLMFDRRNFQFWDRSVHGPLSPDATRVRYWDLAGTAGSGCYTVGLRMAHMPTGEFVVEDIVRGQWGPANVRKKMVETAEVDRQMFDNRVTVYFETQAGSAGKEQADQFIKMLAGFPVYRDNVSGGKTKKVGGVLLPGQSKVDRAMPVAAMVENRNVYLVNAPWNRSFLSETIQFPEAKISDQVDAFSGAFNKLVAKGGRSSWSPSHEKDATLRSAANEILSRQTNNMPKTEHKPPAPHLEVVGTGKLASRVVRTHPGRSRR